MANTDETLSLRFFAVPQWIPFSGLPMVLGASWPVFQALVMLDHRTENSSAHRPNPGNLLQFAVPMVDVCSMSGCSRQRVYQHLRKLASGQGLIVYSPGEKTKQTWPRFQVNRELLGQIYLAVAPRLRQVHGGCQDCVAIQDGRKWYGFRSPTSRALTWAQAKTLLNARHWKPVDPDPDQIAEMIGWRRTAGGVFSPLREACGDVSERDNRCPEMRPSDVSD
ncbi:MAG: hypothetical protein KKI08_14395 [Armatimonadetes bacterium]|nr:hypothetical protein [Armatimonadota bacterium]